MHTGIHKAMETNNTVLWIMYS